jgi:hypothetical protein
MDWWQVFQKTGSCDAYMNFKDTQREGADAAFKNNWNSNKAEQCGRKRENADGSFK